MAVNCVYRFLDKSLNIIYIGRAEDLEKRIKFHDHLPKKCYDERYLIEYVEFPTYDDAKIVERILISKIKPKYNTEFKNNTITLTVLELSNLKWKKWKVYDSNEENISFPPIHEVDDGTYIVKVHNGETMIESMVLEIPNYKKDLSKLKSFNYYDISNNELIPVIIAKTQNEVEKEIRKQKEIQKQIEIQGQREWENELRKQTQLKMEEEMQRLIKIEEEIKKQIKLEAEKEKEKENDKLIVEATKLIFKYNKASITMLQKKLKIGFKRAARLIDYMEEMGIVGEYEGSKPRRILIKNVDDAISKIPNIS